MAFIGLFIVEIIVDVACLVFLCLLMFSCGLLKDDMTKWYDEPSEYAILAEARALYILPIITGLLLLIAHAINSIILFKKRVEALSETTPEQDDAAASAK